jgi:hypothetical protein
MWEALDEWPRKVFLKALADRLEMGEMKPVQSRQERNYCRWDADVIAVRYWVEWEYMKIEGFFPTDKMTNGMKPYVKIVSPSTNTTVIFTCQDSETDLFRRVEIAFHNKALWDTPEKMINRVMGQ